MARLGDLVGDVPPGGRLTLTSGTPVTTSDVTAATSVYYTPYVGNKISLYNGWEWIFHEFSELSLSLSGYTADTNYDIFVYNNGGVLTLESVAWASATARVTNIVRVDGVYVKNGDSTRRYLGTIRTTSTTGQCEDSGGKRYCWNYYNRLPRTLLKEQLTQWHTYNSITWRAFNNDRGYADAAGRRPEMAIGENGNDPSVYQYMIGIGSIYSSNFGMTYRTNILNTGYNYFTMLEREGTSNTSTFAYMTVSIDILG